MTTRLERFIYHGAILVGLDLLPDMLPAQTNLSEANSNVRIPIAGSPPLTFDMVQ
jgi:hypothetical protein